MGKARSQPTTQNNDESLKCSHPGCGLPFVEIRNGCLVIRSKHHGATHFNSIGLSWLLEKLKAEEQSSDRIARDAG